MNWHTAVELQKGSRSLDKEASDRPEIDTCADERQIDLAGDTGEVACQSVRLEFASVGLRHRVVSSIPQSNLGKPPPAVKDPTYSSEQNQQADPSIYKTVNAETPQNRSWNRFDTLFKQDKTVSCTQSLPVAVQNQCVVVTKRASNLDTLLAAVGD